uniref:Uncharacterized protein n=1 Tax=Ceratobasidium virus A TaxID=1964425 RepID=A0A288QF69_9VIRU|nr:hypothetical protein [Ceratobasidium virus A]
MNDLKSQICLIDPNTREPTRQTWKLYTSTQPFIFAKMTTLSLDGQQLIKETHNNQSILRIKDTPFAFIKNASLTKIISVVKTQLPDAQIVPQSQDCYELYIPTPSSRPAPENPTHRNKAGKLTCKIDCSVHVRLCNEHDQAYSPLHASCLEKGFHQQSKCNKIPNCPQSRNKGFQGDKNKDSKKPEEPRITDPTPLSDRTCDCNGCKTIITNPRADLAGKKIFCSPQCASKKCPTHSPKDQPPPPNPKGPKPDTAKRQSFSNSPYKTMEYRMPKKAVSTLEAVTDYPQKDEAFVQQVSNTIRETPANYKEFFARLSYMSRKIGTDMAKDIRGHETVFKTTLAVMAASDTAAGMGYAKLMSFLRFSKFSWHATACSLGLFDINGDSTINAILHGIDFSKAMFGSPRLKVWLPAALPPNVWPNEDSKTARTKAHHASKVTNRLRQENGKGAAFLPDDNEDLEFINIPVEGNDVLFEAHPNPAEGDCLYRAIERLNKDDPEPIDLSYVPQVPTSFNDIKAHHPKLLEHFDFYNVMGGAFFGDREPTLKRPKLGLTETGPATFHWVPLKPNEDKESVPGGSITPLSDVQARIRKYIDQATKVPAKPKLDPTTPQTQLESLLGNAPASDSISPLASTLKAIPSTVSGIKIDPANTSRVAKGLGSITDRVSNFITRAVKKTIATTKKARATDRTAVAVNVEHTTNMLISSFSKVTMDSTKKITVDKSRSITKNSGLFYTTSDDLSEHRAIADSSIETTAQQFGLNTTSRDNAKVTSDLLKLAQLAPNNAILKDPSTCAAIINYTKNLRTSDVVPVINRFLRLLSFLPPTMAVNALFDVQVIQPSTTTRDEYTVGTSLYPMIDFTNSKRPTTVPGYFIPQHVFLSLINPYHTPEERKAIMWATFFNGAFSPSLAGQKRIDFVLNVFCPIFDDVVSENLAGQYKTKLVKILTKWQDFIRYADWFEDAPAKNRDASETKALQQIEAQYEFVSKIATWSTKHIDTKPHNWPVVSDNIDISDFEFIPITERELVSSVDVIEATIPYLPHPILPITYNMETTYVGASSTQPSGIVNFKPSYNVAATGNTPKTVVYVNTIPSPDQNFAPSTDIKLGGKDFKYTLPSSFIAPRMWNNSTHAIETDVSLTTATGSKVTEPFDLLPDITKHLQPQTFSRELTEANRALGGLNTDERAAVMAFILNLSTVNKYQAPATSFSITTAPVTTIEGIENAHPFYLAENKDTQASVDATYVASLCSDAFTSTFGQTFHTNGHYRPNHTSVNDGVLPAHSSILRVLHATKIALLPLNLEPMLFSSTTLLDWADFLETTGDYVVRAIDGIYADKEIPLSDIFFPSTYTTTNDNDDMAAAQRREVFLAPQFLPNQIAADFSKTKFQMKFTRMFTTLSSPYVAQLIQNGATIRPRRSSVKIDTATISESDLDLTVGNVLNKEQYYDGTTRQTMWNSTDIDAVQKATIQLDTPMKATLARLYSSEELAPISRLMMYISTAAQRHHTTYDATRYTIIAAHNQKYYARETTSLTSLFADYSTPYILRSPNIDFPHRLATSTEYYTDSVDDKSTLYSSFSLGFSRAATMLGQITRTSSKPAEK